MTFKTIVHDQTIKNRAKKWSLVLCVHIGTFLVSEKTVGSAE